MEHYSEIFVGIDVAKTRNAIAVAEGERGGEVRAANAGVISLPMRSLMFLTVRLKSV